MRMRNRIKFDITIVNVSSALDSQAETREPENNAECLSAIIGA